MYFEEVVGFQYLYQFVVLVGFQFVWCCCEVCCECVDVLLDCVCVGWVECFDDGFVVCVVELVQYVLEVVEQCDVGIQV